MEEKVIHVKRGSEEDLKKLEWVMYRFPSESVCTMQANAMAVASMVLKVTCCLGTIEKNGPRGERKPQHVRGTI